MKSIKIALLSLCFVLVSTFAFSQKTVWQEQSDFHKVMSATFHPAEEGNFQPIKMRSAELVASANKWRKSDIPADIADKKMVKQTLKKLYKDSRSINKKISLGATDSELKTDLFTLHDTFHTVIGLCNAKEDHEEHLRRAGRASAPPDPRPAGLGQAPRGHSNQRVVVVVAAPVGILVRPGSHVGLAADLCRDRRVVLHAVAS